MSSRRGRQFRSNDRTQSYSNQLGLGRGRNHNRTPVEENWDTQSSQVRNSLSGKETGYNIACAKQNESSAEENWDNNTFAQTSQSWKQNVAPAERDWDSNEYAQTSQSWKPNVAHTEENWDKSAYAQTNQSWKQNVAPAQKDWDTNTYAQTSPSWKQNVAPAQKDWDTNTYAQTSQSWKQNVAPAQKDWDNNTYAQTSQSWKQDVTSAEKDWNNKMYAQTSQSWKQNVAPAQKDWDSNTYAQTSQSWKQNVAPAQQDWDNNTHDQTSQSWKQNVAPAQQDWGNNTHDQTSQSWKQEVTSSEKDWDSNTYAQTSQNWKQTVAPAQKDWDNKTYAKTSQSWKQTAAPAEENQDSSLHSQTNRGWKQNLPSGEENWDNNSNAHSSSWNKGRDYRDEEPVKEYEDFKPAKSFGATRNDSGNDWNSKPVEQDNWNAWDDSKTSDFSHQHGGSSTAGSRIDTMTFSNSRDTRDGRGSSENRADGGTGGSNREASEIEIKISSKLLGLIIGKGGSNIRDLQDKSNTKIHVDRNNVDSSGKASVTIVGSSSAQSEAKRLLEELIESDSQASNRDRQNASWSDQFNSRDNIKEPNSGTLNMEVPSNCVGKIIGKRGCMINDLQISSDARIKVARDNSGPITVISITGSSEAKARAEELIKELIAECTDFQSSPKYEDRTSQQGRSERSDSNAPSANRSGWSDNNAPVANRSGWSEDNTENQGDNGFSRADSWRRPSSPVKNSSQWSSNRASDACGDSYNTHGREKNSADLIDWDKIKEADEEFMKVKWSEFPPVKKDFYIEDVDIANLEPREVERIRKDNNKIMVQHLLGNSGHIPNPIRTFREAFAHYPEILEELRKVGFEKPSPIQMQAWPIILKGQDLIGIAQTGTGKTLAFLLPAFIHIEGQPADRNSRGGANVLVLTPTRELALQIEEEVKKYKYKDIKCVCVYGGGNRKEQISVVTSGVEIMVATPGRLIDLISAKIVDVRSVTYLVLDEADRMLDMGFQPDIRKILLDIRPERQTIMTSATWPVGVRYLATNYMNNPVQVYVGSMDLTACHSVLQRVVMVEEDNKYEELTSLLEREIGENDKVIVFIGRKAIVDYISTQFVLNEIDCQSIHGGREQTDREQALEDLKNGSVRILLATDVASRGIDIKDITHVINYDFPHNIEEYVHRVGRTGRAGRSGQSITFMTRKDWRYAQELIEIMEEAKQEVPQELYDMAARFAANQERRKQEGGTGGGGGGGRGFRRGGNSFRDDFGGFGCDQGGGRRGGGKSFAFSTDGC